MEKTYKELKGVSLSLKKRVVAKFADSVSVKQKKNMLEIMVHDTEHPTLTSTSIVSGMSFY